MKFILNHRPKGARRAEPTISRLHRKIFFQRTDFAWKLGNELVGSYDILCFETLDMKAMQVLWARKVRDYGFADFLVKLEYLARKKGRELVKIDRFYASSKTCHSCGGIHGELSLRDREWSCKVCRTHHDRDLNAAKNIKKAGTSALEGESVRPALAGQVL